MSRSEAARLLSYALAAARRGWRVFPLVPGEKVPAVKGWPEQATCDPDRLTTWWRRPFNPAIATGPSGLVVVDLDTFKPDDVVPDQWALPGVTGGADVLALLAEQHAQPFPANTFTVGTASGGVHLYFAHPADGPELRNTAGTLGFRIDTRAHRGMVVGPGATSAKGTYRVLSAAPVAPLPAWLAHLLAPTPRPQLTAVAPRVSDGRRYADVVLARECQTVVNAPAGQRNATLLRSARALSRFITEGTLTQREITDALSRSAVQVDMSERKALSVINSAIQWATAHDRRIPA